MSIYRVVHNRDNPYTVVNTTIVTDNRLSWKAKGIWLYAFSRPNDWQFHENDLINRSADARHSVRSGLKELEQVGYLYRKQIRDEKGRLGDSDWIFFETPKTKEEIEKMFPSSENPSTENQSTDEENNDASETTNNKTDTEKLKKCVPQTGFQTTDNRPQLITDSNKYGEEQSKDIAQTREKRSSEHHSEFIFSSSSGKFERIQDRDLSDWKEAYPNISISQEIIKAEQWLKAHPTKARKKRWRKFLVGWFSRADEKAENKAAYRSNNSRSKSRANREMCSAEQNAIYDNLWR